MMGENKGSVNRYKTGLGTMIASVAAIVFLLLSGSVSADPVITQGYSSSSNLPAGSIVSVKKGSNDVVQPASISTASSLLGVVIDNNNSQVALSDGSTQLQVATTGVNQALVSDINGKITSGDEITASPIPGVGMLVTQNAEVIGTAQGSFPNNTATKATIKQNGAKQTVNIGTMPVLISVGYFTKQPNKTLLPSAIQSLADAVAGKQVKSLPVLISLAIFVVATIVVASIIYSLIHGSIISIGRNPMSQSAVYRNVLQLSALVVGILAAAMFSIYIILTRLS